MLGQYFAALQHPQFRKLWWANIWAQSAGWGLIVARGWLVFDHTHSSASVGIVTFAAMAPLFFVPPFAGVLADRMHRGKLLQWTFAVNLAHNVALAILALMGHIEMWQIVLLTLVNGSARAVQIPTAQALAANLVPKENLLNALSLSAAVTHGSRLVGPALATPLLGVLGAPAAFFLCSAFYAIGWLQIRGIKLPPVAVRKHQESIYQNFAGGLRYAWSEPVIRMLVVMTMFHCALTMAFESLLPSFSTQTLGYGEEGFGMLMMGVGAGSLVGSLLMARIESDVIRGRIYLLTGLLSGFGQVALAATQTMGFALASSVIMGASQAAFMTLVAAVTQSLAREEYRGRLASIHLFSVGGVMSAMNLANGALGTQFAATSILLVSGMAFMAVMMLAAVFALPRRVYVKGIPA